MEEVNNEYAKGCSRVLRISKFFQTPGRRWMLGIILIVASLIDRLHWQVIGAPARGVRKLNLSGVVDVKDPAVAKTQARILALLSEWSLGQGEWALLQWLGATDADELASKKLARTTLIQLSSALFLKADMRFSSWP